MQEKHRQLQTQHRMLWKGKDRRVHKHGIIQISVLINCGRHLHTLFGENGPENAIGYFGHWAVVRLFPLSALHVAVFFFCRAQGHSREKLRQVPFQGPYHRVSSVSSP